MAAGLPSLPIQEKKSMSRVWLAALGAIAVVACSDDNGSDPNQFPDVGGVYAVAGQFDGVDPSDLSFTGTVTIEQESLESSLLTGTADLTIVSSTNGTTTINDAELLNAGVDLGGNVGFTLEQGAVSWDFLGEKAGDVLTGSHDLTLGDDTFTGTWSGQR
jgi:hypothetical protein